MNGAEQAHGGVFLDFDVAGQRRAVGHDGVVSHLAIMGNVDTGHQQVVAANVLGPNAINRVNSESLHIP